MIVRRKLSLVLGLSMILFIAIIHHVGRVILKRNVLKQEEAGIRDDVSRMANSLEDELTYLDRFTNDYSSRDDTRIFIIEPTDDFLASNVVASTFRVNRINIMVFLGMDGRILHARAFEPSSGQELPLPAELTSRLASGNPWPKHKASPNAFSGVLTLDRRPYLVVSRPILDNRNRTIGGTLIIAKNVDELVIGRLARITNLPVKQLPILEFELPSAVRLALKSGSGKYTAAVQVVSKKMISGFLEVRNVEGRPVLRLYFEKERILYAQFVRSMTFFLGVFVALALLSLIVSEFLIKKLALSRLEKLAAFVKTVNPNADLLERAPIQGRDEISSLAVSVNGMLESLRRTNLERQELIRQLETDSLEDALTGLYNRRGFMTICKEHLNMSSRNKTRMHLLFLDMDNLKQINDTFGHASGDEALIQSSEIIKTVFRETDVKCRLGGDEFAVFPIAASSQGVKSAVIRFNEKIAEFNRFGRHPFTLSFSTGVAGHDPEHPSTIQDLLTRADRRMYEDKRRKAKEAAPR